MIPRIVHQTAPTKVLTWEEARLARRLRRMMPDWSYRLWDDNDNGQLMWEHFRAFAPRYDRIAFGVAKADIARYAYMAVHGGYYFDTDYRLLRPIDGALLNQSCVIPLEDDGPPRGRRRMLGNAVLGSQPGETFWHDLIAFIFDERQVDRVVDRREIIATTGPVALTDFYMTNIAAYSDILLPPKNLFQPDISLMAMRSSASSDTYGVHLNWGSWRGRRPLVALRTFARRKLNALAG